MLKRHFQVKNAFSKCLISALSSTSVSQYFEILIFSQYIWGNVHYVPEINLISYKNLIETFYLPSKTNLKRYETWFCRWKTAQDDNAKIKFSPNIPGTFLLVKTTAFLQIFFLRNFLFPQVLRTSVLLNNKSLKTLNKRRHMPLFINQSVSLIKLKR